MFHEGDILTKGDVHDLFMSGTHRELARDVANTVGQDLRQVMEDAFFHS